METQPEIQFLGLTPTPAIREAIDRHVAELDQLYGRITACRVAVKAPVSITRRADYMKSMFGWNCRTVAKSTWKERRQLTSAMPISPSRSTMPSNTPAGSWRIKFAALKAK